MFWPQHPRQCPRCWDHNTSRIQTSRVFAFIEVCSTGQLYSYSYSLVVHAVADKLEPSAMHTNTAFALPSVPIPTLAKRQTLPSPHDRVVPAADVGWHVLTWQSPTRVPLLRTQVAEV